jgi:serine/threonine protein phosphatase PrpC
MDIHSAIIKGPKKETLQDALGIVNQKDYCLFVIADGLGSSQNSDYGSKTAINAVKKAVIQWRKLRKKNINVLIQLTHFFWNLLIRDTDYKKEDCLTTCLFAYVDKKTKEVILAQLGDGMLFYESSNEKVVIKSKEEYNFTKSLGVSKSIKDWNTYTSSYKHEGFSILVVTDGISEDIVVNKEKEFTCSLIKELSQIKKDKRNRYLRQLLANWPTKFHADDKSIIIGWENKKS